MEDVPLPQARYALLHNSNRKYCLFHNKLILFTLCLTLVSFLILSVYVATVGIYEKVLIPNYSASKDIPRSWVRRALLYNRLDNEVLNITKELVRLTKFKHNNADDYRLVCYYSFPNENSKHKPWNVLRGDDIDPNLCTHVIVGFASVRNNSIYLDDFKLNVSKSVIDLKSLNGNLKVLLSVGGGGNEDGFPEMVLNHENRKTFIKSIDFFVRTHKFDGIDLDWEFPNQEQYNDKKQKVHFTQLLHEIRKEIDRQNKHTYLLSVAVAAPIYLVDLSYDVSYMNDYVDFVNVMTYDFHFYTKFTPFTGINSPLFAKADESGYFSSMNINYSINYWGSKGMHKKKINIGLPTYGHSFSLVNVHNNGLEAPANGYGKLGTFGFIDYNDVCWFLKKNQIKPIFDVDYKSPYASKDTEWISYDDYTSLTFKSEYIKNNRYGGAMVYCLNTDDHGGLCKGKRFPLTNRIKEILNLP